MSSWVCSDKRCYKLWRASLKFKQMQSYPCGMTEAKCDCSWKSNERDLKRLRAHYHVLFSIKPTETAALNKNIHQKNPKITHLETTQRPMNADNELLRWPSIIGFVPHVGVSARRGGCSINRNRLKNLLQPLHPSLYYHAFIWRSNAQIIK